MTIFHLHQLYVKGAREITLMDCSFLQESIPAHQNGTFLLEDVIPLKLNNTAQLIVLEL